ncbi:hypothetical protein HMPREF3227_01727 [Corynebacterium sp. CMW7794]|nr:hypothetical protein HMPREF3227_01727 [Corynebacterium sp. CMW7794]
MSGASWHVTRTAHPRSRGEHRRRGWAGQSRAGSSPLTRGAPRPLSSSSSSVRLIPAHAGSTSTPPTSYPNPPAHPRSRGEHLCGRRGAYPPAGSSPLTRGAPLRHLRPGSDGRLIPAHAGSTGLP